LGPAIKRTERPLGTVSGSEDLKGNVLKGFPLDLPEGGNVRAINIEEHFHHHSCEGRETDYPGRWYCKLLNFAEDEFIHSE